MELPLLTVVAIARQKHFLHTVGDRFSLPLQHVDDLGRGGVLMQTDARPGGKTSAQSDDALDRPLSSYTNAVQKQFLHIEGVRFEINDDLCYQTLLNGTAPPLPDQENN
jgi:hypothetical protein